MIIDNKTLDTIEQKAKESPRLRANLCLHKTPEDKVQKMINVLLPGTEMPIHRHMNSAETLSLLRGAIVISFFDEDGNMSTQIEMSHKTGVLAIDIPKDQWHTVDVIEPTALLEIKEGPYRPINVNEIQK